MKSLKLILLFVIIKIVNSVPVEPNFSYCNALKSSLNFFNANRAGNLTSSDLPILYPWQSGVTTNFDSTIDKALDSNGNGILSGGFFNDGSYIKSTFALAHSITTLAWTFLEFQYNIDSCQGLKKQYLSTLRIGLDWLMVAHPNENTIYAQCGKVGDLSKWNIPSRIYDLYNGSPKRTCWLIINENNPGSDVAHEMASAFAASHMIFSLIDPNYSIQLRTHAIQLFDFGFSYPGKYSDIETSGEQILYPSSDYKDELFWASAWMYQITGKSKYLSIINSQKSLLPNFSTTTTTTTTSSVIYNYDQKYSAAILFLSKNFGLFNTQTNDILNYWSLKMPKTNDGLFFTDQNGSIKYSIGGSLLVAIWNNNQHISKQFKDTFNIDQIKIVLGNNSNDQSYICGVGFLGASTSVNLHHRASHYSISNSITNPILNSFPIQGALVGGPINKFDFYIDDRINFTMNQPSIDYNALLTGVLASMIINETTPEQPDTPTTGPYTTTGTPPPSYTTTGYGTTGYGTTSSKPTTSTTSYSTTGSSTTGYGTTGYGTTGYGSTSSKPTTGGGTGYSTTGMSSSNVGTTTSITTTTSSSPTSLVTTTGSGGVTSSSSTSASTSSPSTSGGTTSNSSTTTTTTASTSSIPTASTTIDGTTSSSSTGGSTTSSSSTSGSTTSLSSTSGSTTISSSTTSTSSSQEGSDSVINTDSQSFGEDSSGSSISSISSSSHENNGSYSTPEQSSSISTEEPTSTPTNTPSPTHPNPTSTPTQTPIPTEKPTKSPINSTEISSESFNTSNRVTQRNSLCSSIFQFIKFFKLFLCLLLTSTNHTLLVIIIILKQITSSYTVSNPMYVSTTTTQIH
ncbi:hypothetical protein ACTFIR_003209 [Dictyostelium discoideum]